ncbi:MAG: hypothetical protein K9W42_09405 [Candidatus Heimdallarchaeota archaeon]|nr:hypothetical protein [Candidatus Heimdallarchaeota archaeon]
MKLKFFGDKTAKSKKSAFSIIITLVIIGFMAIFFVESFISILGVVLAIGIGAGIFFATYFLLKKVGDLPDILH